MNRISRMFGDGETLRQGLNPARPLEALLVHREGLMQILQSSLADLHEHRRQVAGTPAEPETVRRINYWDAVLAWVKAQEGTDVIVKNGVLDP